MLSQSDFSHSYFKAIISCMFDQARKQEGLSSVRMKMRMGVSSSSHTATGVNSFTKMVTCFMTSMSRRKSSVPHHRQCLVRFSSELGLNTNGQSYDVLKVRQREHECGMPQDTAYKKEMSCSSVHYCLNIRH